MITQNRLDMRRVEQEIKREAWKAFAALVIAAVAVIAGTFALTYFRLIQTVNANVTIEGKF